MLNLDERETGFAARNRHRSELVVASVPYMGLRRGLEHLGKRSLHRRF